LAESTAGLFDGGWGRCALDNCDRSLVFDDSGDEFVSAVGRGRDGQSSDAINPTVSDAKCCKQLILHAADDTDAADDTNAADATDEYESYANADGKYGYEYGPIE
jgi:hypothetical protein